MSELLEKVLTDRSARNKTVLSKQAAKDAQLGYGWSGNDGLIS